MTGEVEGIGKKQKKERCIDIEELTSPDAEKKCEVNEGIVSNDDLRWIIQQDVTC